VCAGDCDLNSVCMFMQSVCIRQTTAYADYEVWCTLRLLQVLWLLFCRIGLPGRLVPVGGEDVREGVGGWTWYQYCVHIYVNGKMRPVESAPGLEVGYKGER
jgi:hypothetical protein